MVLAQGNNMLLNILTHTPIWVYGLLVGLIALGWQQSRDRTVGMVIPFILPVAMLFLSLFGVVKDFGFTVATLASWLLALVCVAAVGYCCKKNAKDRFDADARVFFLAGSWWYLFFILLIFMLKYSVGVFSALDVTFTKEHSYLTLMPIAYGALSGVFFVRSLYLLRLVFMAKAQKSD